jgi:NAD(P)-dependent dehydrogenase (short-subunit alcohol dehydrogenase family)
MSVWFITGASRGFGLEIVREALNRGDSVVATARTPESIRAALPDNEHLLVLPLDVLDPEQIAAAVDAAVATFGRIDVLVNNAGRGLLGAIEEASDEEVRGVYDVNVFGFLNVTRAVLPVLRAQRSGKVINISSIGGWVSNPGWGVYSSTKFAVEGLSEAMGRELAPLGIHVTAIEPGAFRTDFLDGSSLVTQKKLIDDYIPTAGVTRQWALDTNASQAGDPVRAAQVIVDLGDRTSLPERIQLGQDSFQAVADKLVRTAGEQEEWREIALSTGFAS